MTFALLLLVLTAQGPQWVEVATGLTREECGSRMAAAPYVYPYIIVDARCAQEVEI